MSTDIECLAVSRQMLGDSQALCRELREQCADYRELVTGYKARIAELREENSSHFHQIDVQKDIEQMLRKRLEKYEDGLGTPHQD